MKTKKLYFVTGTFHEAYVYAYSEGEARRMFHKRYNGENIIKIIMAHELKKITMKNLTQNKKEKITQKQRMLLMRMDLTPGCFLRGRMGYYGNKCFCLYTKIFQPMQLVTCLTVEKLINGKYLEKKCVGESWEIIYKRTDKKIPGN